MRRLMALLLRSDRGQNLIEYALLAAGIALTLTVAVISVGSSLQEKFNGFSAQLSGAAGGSSGTGGADTGSAVSSTTTTSSNSGTASGGGTSSGGSGNTGTNGNPGNGNAYGYGNGNGNGQNRRLIPW